MAKVDLRKTLRAIGNALQDDNQDRLLQALSVSGAPIAARVTKSATSKGRAKRIRLLGIRVSLRELEGKVGVQSGAMLSDTTRRSNVKVGRVSVKIVPSPAVRARWAVFNAGDKHQAARPVSGVSDARLAEASAQIALDARQQFVQSVNRRTRG